MRRHPGELAPVGGQPAVGIERAEALQQRARAGQASAPAAAPATRSAAASRAAPAREFERERREVGVDDLRRA